MIMLVLCLLILNLFIDIDHKPIFRHSIYVFFKALLFEPSLFVLYLIKEYYILLFLFFL